MDKNVKVIYNKLENMSFNNEGYIDLSESKITKTKDLVNVCDVFRNPCYETFRIFYMKNKKIVGQEAITSKIPNAVYVFQSNKFSKLNPIRYYEKMNNRMQRLGADGYYLAHNHCSNSAIPSQADMNITRDFAENVEGFLGHIVLGNSDKYSIIEENSKGQILIPKEKTLSKDISKNMEEQLKEKTLYDIKITNRDELVAILKQIQNEKEYSIAVLTDSKAKIRMVLDIPNTMFNQNLKNLNGFFKNLARNSGSIRVFIGTENLKTYNQIKEHQKYGTIKDMVYFDSKNNLAITEDNIKSSDLFDNKKVKRKEKER